MAVIEKNGHPESLFCHTSLNFVEYGLDATISLVHLKKFTQVICADKSGAEDFRPARKLSKCEKNESCQIQKE
jgi:hypothetical protein